MLDMIVDRRAAEGHHRARIAVHGAAGRAPPPRPDRRTAGDERPRGHLAAASPSASSWAWNRCGRSAARSITPNAPRPASIVAGTNGKGSVTAMAATMLHAAGWRVGRYTSPHLVTLHERIRRGRRRGRRPTRSSESAARVMAVEGRACPGRHRRADDVLRTDDRDGLREFRRQRVDVAVYEVGMGGRFDATNVVSPAVGAITTIDLDHMAYLGDTLGQIAFEKAGIVKPGMPRDRRAPLPKTPMPSSLAWRPGGGQPGRARPGGRHGRGRDATTRVARACGWPRRSHDYGTVPLALRGLHQVENAVVATRLVEALARGCDVTVTAPAIAAGLMTTRWPGRLDLRRTRGGDALLLDAAHNPAGAEALAALPARFAARRRLPSSSA